MEVIITILDKRCELWKQNKFGPYYVIVNQELEKQLDGLYLPRTWFLEPAPKQTLKERILEIGQIEDIKITSDTELIKVISKENYFGP